MKLRKIWSYEKNSDRLAIGHGGHKDIINDYNVTTQVLDGSLSGGYEERGFRKCDAVRYIKAELWYQCDQ